MQIRKERVRARFKLNLRGFFTLNESLGKLKYKDLPCRMEKTVSYRVTTKVK